MRRADRLIKITHFLRQRRRAATAKQIAEAFDICTRTVYRDIQCLMDSNVPIKGEAGVGYLIDKQFYLPPIAFDADDTLWENENFFREAEQQFCELLKAYQPRE